PSGMHRLFVNQAMDNGKDVAVAATVTRFLRQRIGASNAATLVPLADAEGVVEARIDSTFDAPAIGGAVAVPGPVSPTAPAFYVTLNGSIRLIDRDARVVWSGSTAVSENYLAGLADPQCGGAAGCGRGVNEAALGVTESNRRRALERAAEALANEL